MDRFEALIWIKKKIPKLNKISRNLTATFLLMMVLNFFYPQIVKEIMDSGIIAKDYTFIITLSCLLLALVISEQIISLLQNKLIQDIKYKFQNSLYMDIFSKLLHMDIEYFKKKNSTEIYESFKMDIDLLSVIVDSGTISVFNYILRFISGLIGLLIIDVRLTGVVLLFIPIKFILVSMNSSKKQKYTKEFIKQTNYIASWFSDTLNGVKEIKLWNLYNSKQKKFNENQKEWIKSIKKYIMIDFYNGSSDTILNGFVNSILYIGGGWLVIKNVMSVGSIIAFLTYSTYVTGPISCILDLKYLFSKILPSVRRIINFLELEEENSGEIDLKLNDFVNIELKNISFSYGEYKVLKDLSFKIKKGEKIAIIGENGSGKTTIVQLLLRLLKPESGVILLNNKNVQEYNIDSYRKLFSVVSQDIYLFQDSLICNLDLENKYNDKEILKICKKLDMEMHLSNNSGNITERCGINGSNFSGGEKKKIAALRALIKNAPIVIMDEVSANLDAKSVEKMRNLLFSNIEEKTLILITHDLMDLNFIDKTYKIVDYKFESI